MLSRVSLKATLREFSPGPILRSIRFPFYRGAACLQYRQAPPCRLLFCSGPPRLCRGLRPSAFGCSRKQSRIACSSEATPIWIFDLAVEIAPLFLGARPAKHHEAIASCSHQIVTLFDNLAVLAMIETDFFPPII